MLKTMKRSLSGGLRGGAPVSLLLVSSLLMKLRRATVIVQATERRARRVVVLFLRQTVTTDPERRSQLHFSVRGLSSNFLRLAVWEKSACCTRPLICGMTCPATHFSMKLELASLPVVLAAVIFFGSS
jgi:hypothetical protein